MTCQNTLQSTVPLSIVYHHLKGGPAESLAKYDALSFAKENITIITIEAYPDEKRTSRLAKWFNKSSTV